MAYILTSDAMYNGAYSFTNAPQLNYNYGNLSQILIQILDISGSKIFMAKQYLQSNQDKN